MIKYSILTLFTSITILFSAVLADGVVIDHNLPQSVQPGESTVVTVNINKGEVTGFAKLQLEIPAGLTARAINKSGASFTFSGQKAKFIWMSLPDTQDFSVEYELQANASVTGSKVITGQFSYIKENERVDYDLDPKVINVGNVMVDNTETNNADETDSNTNTGQSSNSTASANNASCNRILTQISEGEYFVEVSATDVTTDGFAKIIEDISPGYSIQEDSAGESIVTVEDDRIKFVWFEKSVDNTYEVSYTLIADGDQDKPSVDGKFSYVQNNSPVEVPVIHQEMISARDFGENTEVLVDNTETPEETVIETDSTDTNTTTEEAATAEVNETNTDNSEENTTSESNTQEAIAENTESVENTQTDTPEDSTNSDNVNANTEETIEDITASTIPDPETGVNYKVQLAATHKYVTAANFKKNHKFKETIQTENHEGWTKFVTGSHKEYKDARDARNNITVSYAKFNGPFITAYNSGERITVQEALMISKQKWYQ